MPATKPKPKSKEAAKKAKETVINPPFKLGGVGADLDDIILNGEKFRALIDQSVEIADLVRSMEGASTVEMAVLDSDKRLLRHAMFKTKVGMELDELHFRYVKMAKSGHFTEPTFEDREVSFLRKYKGPKKVLRSKVTRAEFVLSLIKAVKELDIPYYIPELHQVQPVKSTKDHAKAEQDKEDQPGQPGLGKEDVGEVNVKRVEADLGQIHVIDVVLDTGMSMGVNFKVLVSSIMTITQESTAKNLTGGDLDSTGAFQQRASQEWPASGDVAIDARAYFQAATASDKAHPNQSLAELCQDVQGSSDGSLYKTWEEESKQTVELYLGGSAAGSTVSQTIVKPYAFEVKKNETYWKAILRLADEVNWRAFFVMGTFFFISEEDLFRGQVRLRFTEGSRGVDNVDFDVDEGKAVHEATVTAHSKRWSVPPGMVVVMYDLGPADGRWLVSKVEGSLLPGDAEQITIILKKPSKQLPEPAPETESGSLNLPGSGSTTSELASVNVTSSTFGSPAWGGTAPIFKQFIHPFMEDHGISPGAEKEEGHTGGSDHALTSENAYATDYPTNDGAKVANELGRAMGRSGDSVGTYERFEVTVDGKTFSVQILWGVKDHYDHIHVGIQRV